MKRVRLYISSPDDAAEERIRALAVVGRLQQEFEELSLELVPADQNVAVTGTDAIDPGFSAFDVDIFATIIGTSLRNSGTEGGTDTEVEFECAVASHQSNGNPELLVYRKSLPAGQLGAPQLAEVSRFFDKWFLSAEDQTAIGAYHSFADAEQFEDLFTVHLRKLLRLFLPRPNNLPTPTDRFVGRSELIRDVDALLRQSEVRLICLVGSGGTGKSRLGLHIAQGQLRNFQDGVFLAALASLDHADLVPEAIAAAIDIKQHDNRPVIDSVVDALRNKEILLLIDNMEQIKSAVSHLDTLVTKCPRVKVMVTAREAIRVSGVRTVEVPPFKLPDPKKATLAKIRDSESVQLFVERTRAIRPDFELTEENAREVLEICRRLDGIPLAIELATSRMRTVDTTELLRSMEERFASGEGDDALADHQRSLRELISWSYDQLTEDEQTLWRRIAVFTGGFTMEAAEMVCDPGDDYAVDLEIEGLVDKSLASLTFKITDEEEAWVSMLDTLREYALEKLEETGELERFRERFCDWVVELADSSWEELRGAKSDARIARLELEAVNLQAAIGHCRNAPQPDWNRALRIGGGVWFYWFERGMLSTSRELFDHATGELPGLEPGVRARALRALGAVARFQNDIETAEGACQLGLEVYGQLGDISGEANILGELGAIAQRKGEMQQAAEYLDRALALFRQAPDDLHGRSFASAARGVINHLDGDLAGARHFYESALETGSSSGDTDSIASALVNLGEVAEAEGNYDQAYDHYTRSLELYAQRGKKVAIAYCAEIIAGLSSKHRDKYSDAALFLGFADALRKEIESPIEPFNADRLRSDIDTTRRAMTPDTFQASWRAGSSLDVDEFLSVIRDLGLSSAELPQGLEA